MCDYCEKGKRLIDINTRYPDEDFIEIEGNVLHIEGTTACTDGFAGIEVDYKVNYCPMCGRKLTSVEEIE